MRPKNRFRTACALTAALVVPLTAGCHGWQWFSQPPAAAPLGTLSDSVWQQQELNAEQADFIIHQHEFQKDSVKLNTGGEDHVKQIAARLSEGQDALVVVERSFTSPRADTKYHYPVHANAELDRQRREVVVRSLTALGLPDAENRVVVAPSFAQGLRSGEAESAFRQGMQQYGGGGGYGGGFGGFGGFGGGGFF